MTKFILASKPLHPHLSNQTQLITQFHDKNEEVSREIREWN